MDDLTYVERWKSDGRTPVLFCLLSYLRRSSYVPLAVSYTFAIAERSR